MSDHRNDIISVYDHSLVTKIWNMLEKEKVAPIPLSEILLLLPLNMSAKERAERIALRHGFKIETRPDVPYIVFLLDEENCEIGSLKNVETNDSLL